MKPRLINTLLASYAALLFAQGLFAQNTPLFRAEHDPICAPMEVAVSGIVAGAAAYHWDFGNGLTFNQQDPGAITYEDPGLYTISLTITPAAGQREMKEITILSIPGNWWEIFDNVPDLYALVYDAEGNFMFRSNTVTKNPSTGPVQLDVFGLISDEQYQVKVYDFDLAASDDYLGDIWIDGGGPGSATVTEGPLSLSYFTEQPEAQYTHSETAQVGMPAIEQSGDFLAVDLDELGLSPDGIIFQWYLDGELLSGQTTFRILPPGYGTYTAKLLGNGCILDTEPFEYLMTGSYSAQGAAPISVYPNPVAEQVYIAGDIPAGAQLSLYNAAGALLRQSPVEKRNGDFAFSLGNLAPGMYFLKVTSEDGALLHSQVLARQ